MKPLTKEEEFYLLSGDVKDTVGTHPCIGCRFPIAPEHLVCGACWRSLPREVRKEVYTAWDLGRGKGSDAHYNVTMKVSRFLIEAGIKAERAPAALFGGSVGLPSGGQVTDWLYTFTRRDNTNGHTTRREVLYSERARRLKVGARGELEKAHRLFDRAPHVHTVSVKDYPHISHTLTRRKVDRFGTS